VAVTTGDAGDVAARVAARSGPCAPPADHLAVTLASGSKVLICSDLRLGDVATETSLRATTEIAERLSSWSEPGAIVLNGGCFDLLGSTRPSVDAVLDAHPDFEKALAVYAGDGARRVVVNIGAPDAPLATDDVAREVIEDRLGATVAHATDLVLETSRGVRVVRVEHGDRFGPVPAPGPGPELVQQVAPAFAGREILADAPWLTDQSQFGRYLGSRVVYRALVGRAWWLAVPFLAALAVRTPLVVRGLSDTRGAQQIGRWLVVAGVGVVVDVAVLASVAVLVARRVFRSLAATRMVGGGPHQNEPPRAAGEALCAEGFAGFVTGHTHHPELTPLHPEGFYANSGCGVPVVEARSARAGLPPVFTATHRRSWLELDTTRGLEAGLVVADTPLAGNTRAERLAARRRPVAPSTPTVVSAVPGGTSWPMAHADLQARSRRDRRRRIAAGLVLLVAVVGLLSATTPPLHGRLDAVDDTMPVELPQAASATLVFASFGLLLLARSLRRGGRLAWAAVISVLTASALLHLAKGVDVEEAVVAMAVAAWLAVHAADFPVRPLAGTVRRSALLAAGATAAAVTTSFVLVGVLGAHRRTADAARLVAPALSASALGLAAAAAWVLFGPRRHHTPSESAHRADRERARGIVGEHGGDSLAYFALRDDKDWFFTGSSVIAYSVRNGVCLVSPDPIGPAREWADTWAEFAQFADRNGWPVAVVGAQPGWLPVYAAAGMTSIYMGDEAIVDCQAFSLGGGPMKSLRGAYNRVKKAGFTTVFLDPSAMGGELEGDLRDLMTDTRQGATERGFSMTLSRIFDPADTGLLLSVALDPDGRPAAFCQWVPAADMDGWSLDLMRRRGDPDLPNGVTDFVVIETIEHLKATHRWGLALNFAVLRELVAGERDGGFSELQRRVLHRLSGSMQIESLWRYNQKFQPYWRPRYVVVDAVEHAAAQGVAIAQAESLSELPIIGRFLRGSAARPSPPDRRG
jgi:lysyl-tRNA synthetase class 2